MENIVQTIAEMRLKWKEGDDKRDAGVIDPENIVRHTDIPYGEYPENLLDVYYPEGTDRPLPTIISIHGGGWFYGSKKLYSHYCLRLASRGFTVVNFDFSQRILKPVIIPSSPTISSLQKIVGIPSFFISGAANCANVSLRIITWQTERSPSKNSFAPSMGLIVEITF